MKNEIRFHFTVLSVIIFYCLCAISVKSQIPTPQFVVPSANAYSLGKYGEMPVGTYTGVPDISIPLTSLSQNEVSVNVSLSYHGGGVKVDEMASWVGLNWSLNAGGVITRVVRGRPEYLLSNGQHYPVRGMVSFYSGSGDRNNFIAANNLQAIESGSLDGEPDEFFFNFQGRSGRFWFDKNGKAVLNKNEALDINWVNNGSNATKFLIKTEDGTTYEFGKEETAYFSDAGSNLPTAWHVTKIISANNNEINFEYYSPISITQSIRYYSEYTANAQQTSLTPQTFTDFGLPQSEVFLKKISSRNGWIEFIRSSSQRLDYRTNSFSYALDEIRIYTNGNVPLKKYKFYTSYFEANNARKYDGISPTNYEHLNYRLRLDSIAEFATDFSTKKPAMQFYYLGDNNPSTDDAYTLPYRLSPEQDHWGYYNKSGNDHIFPAPPADNSNINLDRIYEYFWEIADRACTGNFSLANGANRNPDTAAMKACTLNLIRYPTGGTSLYTFEANAESGIFYSGGLRIKNIINYSNTGTPVQTKFTYGPGIATVNPVEYYFTRYCVSYGNGTFPNSTYLEKLGLPTSNPGGNSVMKFLKIRIFPQAVLGNGAGFGYASVTVAQTGNGRSIYQFAEPGEFPDYVNNEYIAEGVVTNKLDKLYGAQYITGVTIPDYGLPGGADFSLSIRFSDFPYLPLYSNDWKRGVLTRKEEYNEGNKLIRVEIYKHTRTFLDTIGAVKVVRITDAPEFVFAKYFVAHALIQKTRDSIVVFDMNGANPLTTTTNYYFDNAVHLQNTKVVTTNSKGEVEAAYMKYPLDYNLPGTVSDPIAQGIKLLQTKHLVNPIIEKYVQKSKQDNSSLRTISASFVTFKTTAALPDKAYNWEPSQLPGNFAPATISSSSVTKSPDYKPAIISVNFDANGNLLQQQKADDIKTSYQWGYNQSYPVAQAINAENSLTTGIKEFFYQGFEEEATAATATPHAGKKYYSGDYTVPFTTPNARSYLVNYHYLDGSVWKSMTKTFTSNMILSEGSAIDEVRVYPNDALITTYTYAPQIGMTSQTDPAGRTTIYEYDNFQRLNLIRDHDKNILKNIHYSYAGHMVSIDQNWQVTGITRCQPCSSNSSYLSNIREHQEKDMNPSSPTYNTVKWVSDGVNSSCTASPAWQNTTTSIRCKKNGANQNTGEQEQEQKDMNPCSSTYNSTRWVVVGTNTTACPLPSVYQSQDKSGNYTRNNCGPGYVGGTVYVSIPAGSYTSTISAADADSKAIAYGQSQANSNGSCTPDPNCSFTMASGYSSSYNNISISGSTVWVDLDFTPSQAMYAGTSYKIATINGSCRPTAQRSLYYTLDERTWAVTIYTNGEVWLQLSYDSQYVTAGTWLGTFSFQYTK